MPAASSSFDYEAALPDCAKGDSAALHRIYQHESHRLLGVALRIVRDRARAEDVLHDAFMNLWTKAVIIGTAIEGVLFALICGESGPCAPSSMGLIGILSHFPAVMLVWPLSGFDLPDWSYQPLLFAFGCLFWIMISYAFLVTRDRK